jgi:endonuclease/exonuclease/phosphatase family metal-dependent hydrolase
MKRYALFAICGFVGVFVAGCVTMPEANFNPDEPHLAVVTYNVNWGFSGAERIVDFISKSNADVVCLQETHSRWESVLRRDVGAKYPYCAFREWSGAGGIAIMSKYKLRNVELIKPVEGWFPALAADAETPIGTVKFLNVHLRPPLSDRGSANVSALYEVPKIHVKEIESFMEEINESGPMIIAGDFNEDENGRAISGLVDDGFTDALSVYDKRSKTWNWELSYGVVLRERYDHIIFSKELKCTGAKVVKVGGSDHEPVLAVLVSGIN